MGVSSKIGLLKGQQWGMYRWTDVCCELANDPFQEPCLGDAQLGLVYVVTGVRVRLLCPWKPPAAFFFLLGSGWRVSKISVVKNHPLSLYCLGSVRSLLVPVWAVSCTNFFQQGFWCYWTISCSWGHCCILPLLTSVIVVVGSLILVLMEQSICPIYTLWHTQGILYMLGDMIFLGGRPTVLILYFDSTLLITFESILDEGQVGCCRVVVSWRSDLMCWI